jgi:signal transduction histidine kinase
MSPRTFSLRGGGAGADPAERAAFLDSITAGNLRRIWWLMIVGGALDLAVAVANFAFTLPMQREIGTHQLIDLGLIALMLPLVGWMRRRPERTGAARAVVLIFSVLMLLNLTAYFFHMLPGYGLTPDYILGPVILGAIVLIPPRTLLALLLGNHALYVAVLLALEADKAVLVPALADGTTGMVVGMMTGWFLFQSRWNEFRQQRLAEARNRELAVANAELQSRNAELAELMGLAAHDLRTPLLGVKNLLDLIVVRPALTQARLNDVLAEAGRTCGDVLHLVERLLAAHEAERPGELAPLQMEDLGAVFQAAAERARRLGQPKGIRVELTRPPRPALAPTRAAMLADVLDNLLGNALKFSPPGAGVEVALFAGDGFWIGEVRDDGPGVPPEEQPKLFRKFHHGGARPTAGEASTGLGLFIVKTLTESMGGRVSFEAREPRGAVFRLELPIWEAVSAPGAP